MILHGKQKGFPWKSIIFSFPRGGLMFGGKTATRRLIRTHLPKFRLCLLSTKNYFLFTEYTEPVTSDKDVSTEAVPRRIHTYTNSHPYARTHAQAQVNTHPYPKESFQSGSGSNPPQKDIPDPPTTIEIWHVGDNARKCSQLDFTRTSMLQGRKKQNIRLRWKRVSGRAQLLNLWSCYIHY